MNMFGNPLGKREAERLWFTQNPLLIWRIYRLSRPGSNVIPAIVREYLDDVAERLEANPPKNDEQVARAFGFPKRGGGPSESTRAKTLLKRLDHFELVQTKLNAGARSIEDAAETVAEETGKSSKTLRHDYDHVATLMLDAIERL